jgi:tRNA dimethylallyltransferase
MQKLIAQPLVIAVVGPTCSGKTKLAIDLARELKGEILCADSRTIYKEMNIGTAKPTADEQNAVRHHLLDLALPTQTYTLAQFQKAGLSLIESLQSQEKVPVVAGGTGLYVRALLEGLSIPEVEPNQELREELQALAALHGREYLRGILQELDPQSAASIGPNDAFRLIRAIEVSKISGRPFSQLKQKKAVPFQVIWLGLTYTNREVLKYKIEERLKEQLSTGLIEETRALLEKYGHSHTLENTVAYKEVLSYLAGKINEEEALKEAIAHTYALARRQIIWFRANKEINWFAVDEMPYGQILTASREIISAHNCQQK